MHSHYCFPRKRPVEHILRPPGLEERLTLGGRGRSSVSLQRGEVQEGWGEDWAGESASGPGQG